MKLYLSSFGFGTDREPFRELIGDSRRCGVIANARDGFGEDRMTAIPEQISDLDRLGFDCDEVDLRVYFDDQDRLVQVLESLDLLWVVGGNVFVLARAIHHSGFAGAVHDLVMSDRLVYAGYSAGACVAGPDLDGLHLIDDPDALPEGYPRSGQPQTLEFVPYRIVPHWRSDHPESASAEQAAAYLDLHGLDYRPLRDGQAIVTDGDVTLIV